MADFPSYFYPVTELIDCIRVFECPQWEDLSNSTEQYTTGAEETGGEKRWKQNTEEEKKKQAGDRKKNQFCKQIIATFFSISQINDYLLLNIVSVYLRQLGFFYVWQHDVFSACSCISFILLMS